MSTHSTAHTATPHPRCATSCPWPTMLDAQFEAQYPNVSRVLASGYARVDEHGDIIGTAADGVEVGLGTVYRVDLAEVYLADYPTPATW